MRSERVEFPNEKGERLSGILDLPDGAEPAHLAVFAHCFTCSKDFKLAVNIDKELVARGIAVLRFDFTGLGQSGGEFSDTNFSSNARDITCAARFLGERRALPRLLIGHSLGGAAALFSASSLPTVAALVTIATPSSPAHLMRYLGIDRERLDIEGEAEVTLAGRRLRIKKQFVEDIQGADLKGRIERLGRALLVMHSPEDALVGVENAHLIFDSAPHPKSFIALDGADHLLNREEDSRYAGALIGDWVLRYLTDRTAES